MAQIVLQQDTLDAETERFAPAPLTRPLFMTSLQKSGTHLLRNILRMFIPLDQQYRRGFIQAQTLRQHQAALDPSKSHFSFGHLAFSPAAAVHLAKTAKLLIYRDPYDWVLARARFFSSDQFEDNLPAFKNERLPVEERLTLMVTGVPGRLPSLRAAYDSFVVPWTASQSVSSIRYEELARHSSDPGSKAGTAYFAQLFDAAGIERPDNWIERVAVGSDPARSGTARQNLTGVSADLPDALSEQHRRLVDYSAPGLRELLGYA